MRHLLLFPLTFIFLLGPHAGAATKRFSLSDCEEDLLGRKGEIARSKVIDWLHELQPVHLQLTRFDLSANNLIADGNHKGYDVFSENIKYQAERPPTDTALSRLELLALGADPGLKAMVGDVTARLVSQNADEMFLKVYRAGLQIGEVPLSKTWVMLGFRNAVQSFQSQWEQEGERVKINHFFYNHGEVLLRGPHGKVQFGYSFGLYNVGSGVKDLLKDFEITIYSVRDCANRIAQLRKELIFPVDGRESGAKNLCLDDLALRFMVPYVEED